MRGTRLWQATGSPIIQGRSKAETPLMVDLSRALAVTGVCGVVYHVVFTPLVGGVLTGVGALAKTALLSWLVAVVPVLVTLQVARAARSRRAWLVSGVVGAVVAVLVLWLGVSLF